MNTIKIALEEREKFKLFEERVEKAIRNLINEHKLEDAYWDFLEAEFDAAGYEGPIEDLDNLENLLKFAEDF